MPFSCCRLPPNLSSSQVIVLLRIRRAQVHVMQAEQLRILHDLDARAPRILEEGQLEQLRHVAHRRRHLDAGGLPLLHLGVEIGNREADVIDGAAGARLGGRVSQEHQTRAAVHDAIGRFGDPPPAGNVLLVPRRRDRGIRHVQVDVIVRIGRGLRARRADQQQRRRPPVPGDIERRSSWRHIVC